jgi:ribose-phosphate pyrophosphokinase
MIMIKVFSDNKEIPVNKVVFSDGAFTYKLDSLPVRARYISVVVDPSTPVYLVREELLLVTECISALADEGYFYSNVKLILSLEYLPYARCDRRFETGNPNALLSFLETLDNIGGFDEIIISDIHNRKAVDDIIDKYDFNLNIIEKAQLRCFKESLSFDHKKDWDVVLSPDKGAREKAATIANYLGLECVYASKKRDLRTGKLTEMILPEYDFSGKKVLIPDDLCDRGNTHMWLASLLKERGAERVDLYVTHAILPERFTSLENSSIDNLIAYQTVGGYINKEDIKNFNLREEK